MYRYPGQGRDPVVIRARSLSPRVPPPRGRTSPQIVRVAFVVTVLGILSGLIVTLAFFLNSETAGGAAPLRAASTKVGIDPMTPTPAPFVRQASPEPVTPFPTTVQRQVDALAAKDRFFFHGSYTLPEVALTFDDGPSDYTPQVLAVLKRYGVKATFFCMGQHVAEHPNYVQQEQADGHAIGNHTWTHPHLQNLSSDSIYKELTDTSDLLQKVTGTRPTIFRPPYGEYDAHVLTAVNQLGLTTFIWNDMPRDWENPPPAVISTRTINSAAYGSIVLLHDGGGDPRANTVAALPTIIERLQARGLRLVTLPQMVADVHKTSLAPGASSLASIPVIATRNADTGEVAAYIILVGEEARRTIAL